MARQPGRKEERMKLQKVNNRLEVKASGDETVLYIYGTIGEDWYGEGITAKSVRDQLDKITASEITVRINSGGGSVFDGIAIMNLLKSHPARIKVLVDGYAASAASVIAMAGDEIIMPSNTMMMIHRPWTFAYGNVDELMEVCDSLEKIGEATRQSYMDRFTGDAEAFNEIYNKESYLTAEECLAYGLCDKVTSESKSAADEPQQPEPDERQTENKEPQQNTLLIERFAAAVQSGIFHI